MWLRGVKRWGVVRPATGRGIEETGRSHAVAGGRCVAVRPEELVVLPGLTKQLKIPAHRVSLLVVSDPHSRKVSPGVARHVSGGVNETGDDPSRSGSHLA